MSTTISKYQVSWLIIEEINRKKTTKKRLAELNRIKSGFVSTENSYVRHFPDKESAQAIQQITGGVVICDAQMANSNEVGNVKLSSTWKVTATAKQLQHAK